MKSNAVAGWHEIGGQRCFFRSKSEKRYCSYLEWLRINQNIQTWSYEPKTFWFNQGGANLLRGTVSYKPDFLVTCNDNSHYWVEVKGFMDAKSKTKINRFAKYFPKEKLEVVDSSWFSRNSPKLKGLVPGWD